MFVVTIDQRDSTHQRDQIPELLELLSDVPTLLPFERTVGDEAQALLKTGMELMSVCELVLRDGRFSMGIGIGGVERPMPSSTREAKGSAFTAAREAIENAKRVPLTSLSLVAHRSSTRQATKDGEEIDAVLWPWAALICRRSQRQWQAIDALGASRTQKEAAESLGVSVQAFSRRLKDSHARQLEDTKIALSHLLDNLAERYRAESEEAVRD